MCLNTLSNLFSFSNLKRAVQLDNSSLVCDIPTFALRTAGRNWTETKLFEDIRELTLGQWIFGGLKFEKKKKAKRCEAGIWPHFPLKIMILLKAITRETEKSKNFHSPMRQGKGSKNRVYIHPGGRSLINQDFWWVPK